MLCKGNFAYLFLLGCLFSYWVLRVLYIICASLVAQMVKKLPAMWETWVQSLGQEDPLEKEMATHSNILAWRSQWTEEPDGYSPLGHKESDMTEWLILHNLDIYLVSEMIFREILSACADLFIPIAVSFLGQKFLSFGKPVYQSFLLKVFYYIFFTVLCFTFRFRIHFGLIFV